MFDRLKRVLVETFVGAIALGYLLASAILFFVNIFPASFAAWLVRSGPPIASGRFSLETALRPAISFVVLLIVWYVLLRWLYFTPPKAMHPRKHRAQKKLVKPHRILPTRASSRLSLCRQSDTA
jgi:hypothetical protein